MRVRNLLIHLVRIRRGGLDSQSGGSSSALCLVAPCQENPQYSEDDVEQHVEAEVRGESLAITRGVAALEDLKNGVSTGELGDLYDEIGQLTCGAVIFPAAHATKVMASVVDFLVWPATFREMREKIRLPSAR